jgi:hypothetical protein
MVSLILLTHSSEKYPMIKLPCLSNELMHFQWVTIGAVTHTLWMRHIGRRPLLFNRPYLLSGCEDNNQKGTWRSSIQNAISPASHTVLDNFHL